MKQIPKFLLKKILFPLGIGFLSLIFIGFLSFHFLIADNLDDIKIKIFEHVQKKIGHEFTVDTLVPDWKITNPSFTLYDVSVFNQDKSQALNIKKIQADISWLSLIKLSPVFDEIVIHQPELDIKKGADGNLSVNGISFNQEKDSGFSNWLLNQDDIVIYGATISWLDITKTPETLTLKNLDLHYGSSKIFSYKDRRNFRASTNISHGTPNKLILNGYIDISTAADINTSNGQINLDFVELDIGAIKLWTEYLSDIESGNADGKINIHINNGVIKRITSKINMDNFKWLTEQNKKIIIDKLSGLISWEKTKEYSLIKLSTLNMNIKNSLSFKDAEIILEIGSNDDIRVASLNINRINLNAINDFILKLPSSISSLYTKYASISPSGFLTGLKFDWEKNQTFNLDANVLGVSVMPFEGFPGVTNITGEVRVNNHKGYIKSVSNNISIKSEDIFRGLLEFEQFSGIISWDNNIYKFQDINIKNPDLQAEINGKYSHRPNDESSMDMEINIANILIGELKDYYPKQFGKKALNWLDTSLLKGTAKKTAIKFNGKLADFPFVDENNKPDQNKGLFTLRSNIKDSFIEYGLGWPEIDAFDFNVEVNNNYIKFTGLNGHIKDNKINSIEAVIDGFNIESPLININAVLDAPANKMINAINNSPLRDSVKGVTENMTGQGLGELQISLVIPVNDVDNIQFNGTYDFQGSKIKNPKIGIPEIENIYGILEFDNNNVSIKKSNASLYNSPLNIELATQNGVNQFKVNGVFNSAFVEEIFGSQFSNNINGEATWNAEINLFDEKTEINVSSNMSGLSINSLGPLDKNEGDLKIFNFSKKSLANNSENIKFKYGESITAEINQEKDSDGTFIKKVGLISVNSPNNVVPKSGVRLIANLDYINLEDYQGLIGSDSDSFLTEASLLIKELNVMNYKIHNASIKYMPSTKSIKYMPQNENTVIKIESNEVSGNLSWNSKKNFLVAELKKVNLITEDKVNDNKEPLKNPPKLDLKINSLKIDNEDYGYVEFKGDKVDSVWNIDHFIIERGGSPISGNGYWSSDAQNPTTNINFDWKMGSVEHTMEKLGYKNLIKNGKNASITGILNWNGSPFNFDSKNISGSFLLQINDGTILESEPGVARLFGLLTLQNLPRRLSLDFSDIFRKGFMFDSISANVKVDNGVLYSDNFKMSGPAANVLMGGQVSIANQTQDLHVIVKPRVSDSLSLAGLVGGPLVGAATFIAQKILRDPLNKILTSEYKLIGTWDEPEEVPVKDSNSNKNLYLQQDTLEEDPGLFGNIIDKTIVTPASEIIDFLNPL